MVDSVVREVLPGLDQDLQQYISSVVMEDGRVMERDDLLDMVGPLLLSADYISDESKAESIVDTLLEKLANLSSKNERPEVVLLKNAVLMGGADKEAETIAKTEALLDPMLKRRGGQAFGTNVVEEELDVHSKAAIAKARQDAKAQAKRALMAEQAMREQLLMEAELEEARRAVARARLSGEAPGALGTIESEPFELPNPGGGENLLDDVRLRLVPGHRYGLIGRNGKGKSTLLRYLSSRRVKGLPPLMSIHYVAQELPLAQLNELVHPVEMVLRADVERVLLLEEQQVLERQSEGTGPEAAAAAVRLAGVHERLVAIDAEGAEGRARATLVNLGFSEELLARPMKALSGGWRVRVALAAALFAAPDLLLLDEPTNHLAIDAVLWLQRHLATSAQWKSRIIVVVSHDRTFLDHVCTDMLHISGVARQVTVHRGNYSAFEAKRAEMQAAWEKSKTSREERRDKLLEYTRRQGKAYTFQGTIAAKMMRIKMIEKSDAEAEAEEEELAFLGEDEELELTLKGGGELELPVASFRNVGFAYEGQRPLFSGVDLCVDGKSRICLLGENGAGKTTLVKLMMGLLEPTSGIIQRDMGARFALVNQHHADQINLDLTPLHWMHMQFPGDGSYAHEQELRKQLAQCGVTATMQTTPAHCLSGGQRSRVALAAVAYRKPHVLIMDEPTNNLDLESVSALAKAVSSFPGGVVLVSHDQTFVAEVAKEIWILDGKGTLTRCETFDAYRRQVLSRLRAA